MELLGFYVSDWILYLVVFLTSVYLFFTWNFDVLRKLGVPHPKPLPIIGNSIYLLKHGANFDSVMYKAYGNIFGWYEGRDPVICTTDPDILRHVLIKEFHNFTDRRYLPFRGYLIHSVFDERGAHWRGMRNILTPAFSSGKIKLMMKPMQNSVNHLIDQMGNTIKQQNGIMESKRAAGMFTMDVIAAVAFGIDLDCTKDPKNPFATMGRHYFDVDFLSLPIILLFGCSWICPLIEKIFALNMFDKVAENFFVKMIHEIIQSRKEFSEKGNDFLGIVMDAEKHQDMIDEEDKKDMETSSASKLKELTNQEIIGNALLFFAAGFETTATTLGFLLYFLSVNEDIQEQLRQEVIDIAGDKPTTYDVLSKMHFVEQCIFETLRMCPPVPRLDREAQRDIKIGGLLIPKGILVNIPILVLHRIPEIWPEPEKWEPDRFSPEEKAKRDPMYFMPFGLGPRQCIGMRLALLEIKMAVCDLLRKYRFIKTPETPVPLTLKKDALLCVSEKPLIIKVENL